MDTTQTSVHGWKVAGGGEGEKSDTTWTVGLCGLRTTYPTPMFAGGVMVASMDPRVKEGQEMSCRCGRGGKQQSALTQQVSITQGRGASWGCPDQSQAPNCRPAAQARPVPTSCSRTHPGCQKCRGSSSSRWPLKQWGVHTRRTERLVNQVEPTTPSQASTHPLKPLPASEPPHARAA